MEKRTSAFARIFAALALLGAVVVVVVVIASSGGDGSSTKGQGSGNAAKKHGHAKKTTAASYTVQIGDTLTSIAHETGVPVNEIIRLNPEVDPQILRAGEKLKLR